MSCTRAIAVSLLVAASITCEAQVWRISPNVVGAGLAPTNAQMRNCVGACKGTVSRSEVWLSASPEYSYTLKMPSDGSNRGGTIGPPANGLDGQFGGASLAADVSASTVNAGSSVSLERRQDFRDIFQSSPGPAALADLFATPGGVTTGTATEMLTHSFALPLLPAVVTPPALTSANLQMLRQLDDAMGFGQGIDSRAAIDPLGLPTVEFLRLQLPAFHNAFYADLKSRGLWKFQLQALNPGYREYLLNEVLKEVLTATPAALALYEAGLQNEVTRIESRIEGLQRASRLPLDGAREQVWPTSRVAQAAEQRAIRSSSPTLDTSATRGDLQRIASSAASTYQKGLELQDLLRTLCITRPDPCFINGKRTAAT